MKNIFKILFFLTCTIFSGCALPFAVHMTENSSGSSYYYDPDSGCSYTTNYIPDNISAPYPPMLISENDRFTFDDILFLQHRITKSELKWSYIKLWENGDVGIVVHEFLPWKYKRFNKNCEIAKQLVVEMEKRSNSNKEINKAQEKAPKTE